MEFIIRPPGTGKTTDLIKRASEENLYIVCRGTSRANDLNRRAVNMGKSIPFPLTFHEFLYREYAGRYINGFLIDDVDKFLNYMTTGANVVAVTASIAPVE